MICKIGARVLREPLTPQTKLNKLAASELRYHRNDRFELYSGRPAKSTVRRRPAEPHYAIALASRRAGFAASSAFSTRAGKTPGSSPLARAQSALAAGILGARPRRRARRQTGVREGWRRTESVVNPTTVSRLIAVPSVAKAVRWIACGASMIMKPASGALWNTLSAAEEAEFAAVQASCVPLYCGEVSRGHRLRSQ
jgi:hypothetical protein